MFSWWLAILGALNAGIEKISNGTLHIWSGAWFLLSHTKHLLTTVVFAVFSVVVVCQQGLQLGGSVLGVVASRTVLYKEALASSDGNHAKALATLSGSTNLTVHMDGQAFTSELFYDMLVLLKQFCPLEYLIELIIAYFEFIGILLIVGIGVKIYKLVPFKAT